MIAHQVQALDKVRAIGFVAIQWTVIAYLSSRAERRSA